MAKPVDFNKERYEIFSAARDEVILAFNKTRALPDVDQLCREMDSIVHAAHSGNEHVTLALYDANHDIVGSVMRPRNKATISANQLMGKVAGVIEIAKALERARTAHAAAPSSKNTHKEPLLGQCT